MARRSAASLATFISSKTTGAWGSPELKRGDKTSRTINVHCIFNMSSPLRIFSRPTALFYPNGLNIGIIYNIVIDLIFTIKHRFPADASRTDAPSTQPSRSLNVKVLVINSGSSSLKFTLFDMTDKSILAKGLVERIGMDNPKMVYQPKGEKFEEILTIQ
ncbi:MAG: hypothetical protein II943_10440, partial [Victivallales bacterium]|nr:hypothetical protein [Victivallales bacterium]